MLISSCQRPEFASKRLAIEYYQQLRIAHQVTFRCQYQCNYEPLQHQTCMVRTGIVDSPCIVLSHETAVQLYKLHSYKPMNATYILLTEYVLHHLFQNYLKNRWLLRICLHSNTCMQFLACTMMLTAGLIMGYI